MRVLACLLLLCASACPRPQPRSPPAPPPPPIAVPAGCERDLSGPWMHAADPSYRYRGVDDGGTLVLTAFRVFAEDAGFVPRHFLRVDGGVVVVIDAGAPAGGDAGADGVDAVDGGTPSATVVVTRTPKGFVGETAAEVLLPTGRPCKVRYPTTVMACADGGLLVRSRSALAVGDACQPPPNPQPAPDADHQLVRPGARFH